ncbi:hypothetical protein FHS39_002730 [Streptomyces olivoverticillatus]|uniref:Uncharacterized protein n=1 Tax=Streptomyces olivoverticillatus TaxID=66427 RepID=A0A7W7LP59_9ACTN|nr:hypothetical protein [Streptomyces olivoverticillatus]MBB4893699.1 hypothetical protein [Streptomyces olivoverticillatus]
MGSAVTFAVTFEELGRISGEVLPARTVLSSVSPVGTDNPMYPMLVRTEHGATVAYACQYHQEAGSPGLMAALGLAPSSPAYTVTCVPAAISSH